MTHLLRASTVVSWPLRHALAVLLLAGTAFAGNATATTYRIVELPLPPTATNPTVVGINATGDVVGYVDSSTTKEFATVWSAPDYAMRVLPQEDAYRTKAVAISDAGDIIGSASFRGDPSRPVMWRSNGTLVRMAEITRRGYGAAVTDINTHGTVVGLMSGPNRARPAIWITPQRFRLLRVANPDSGYGVEVWAVNDSGKVVGIGPVIGDNRHALYWTPGGGVRDLGDLPGGSDHSGAHDVNEAGQIVGHGSSAAGGRAVMWNPDGSMLDLGSLPGDVGDFYYDAYDINNLGMVLGWTAGSEVIHFLWTAGSGMLRVADVIDPLDPWYRQLQSGDARIYTYDINDAGVIVGSLFSDSTGLVPVMLLPQSCTGGSEPQVASPHRGAAVAITQGTGCL